MSKRNKRFGKHSHNPTRTLRRASLDYSKTHQQFANYVESSLNDLIANRAHVHFTKRPVHGPIKPKVTQLIIRALVPGETCEDFGPARTFLFELATALKLGQDCGRLTIVPRGAATEITVTKY